MDMSARYTWFFTADEDGARWGILDGSNYIAEYTMDYGKKCPTKDLEIQDDSICFGHGCGYTKYEGCKNFRYWANTSMKKRI